MSWLDFFTAPENSYQQYEGRIELENMLLDGFYAAWREKHVTRMNHLIKASLNERQKGAGDKGMIQAQIRVLNESIHDDLLKRFNGDFKLLDSILDKAEKSAKDRMGWLEAVLNDDNSRQYEMLLKMAA